VWPSVHGSISRKSRRGASAGWRHTSMPPANTGGVVSRVQTAKSSGNGGILTATPVEDPTPGSYKVTATSTSGSPRVAWTLSPVTSSLLGSPTVAIGDNFGFYNGDPGILTVPSDTPLGVSLVSGMFVSEDRKLADARLGWLSASATLIWQEDDTPENNVYAVIGIVPEPSSAFLFALGTLGLAIRQCRTAKQNKPQSAGGSPPGARGAVVFPPPFHRGLVMVKCRIVPKRRSEGRSGR